MSTRQWTDRRMLRTASRLLLWSAGTLSCIGCSWDQLSPFPSSSATMPAPVSPQDSVVLAADRLADSGPVHPELTSARELFRQKDYGKAEKIYHRVAEANGVKKSDSIWHEIFSFTGKKNEGNAAVAEEARFYEAECLFEMSDYPRAVDTYTRLLNDFGSGIYREQACQRLFHIANYWLEDTREGMRQTQEVRDGRRWFTTPNLFHMEKTKPFFDQEGRALQALEQVRYNDISGPLADRALFLLGSVYFFNENYREADYQFTQLVETHPNSQFAARATELAIISKHMCTGGSDYDGRKVAEARALVHKAQMSYPELTRNPENREFLERQLVGITFQQAEKDYKMAEFYRRRGKPCPAYFMYEVVRLRYPGTKYAELATERMHELRAAVEKENGGNLPIPAMREAGSSEPTRASDQGVAPRMLPDLGQR